MCGLGRGRNVPPLARTSTDKNVCPTTGRNACATVTLAATRLPPVADGNIRPPPLLHSHRGRRFRCPRGTSLVTTARFPIRAGIRAALLTVFLLPTFARAADPP